MAEGVKPANRKQAFQHTLAPRESSITHSFRCQNKNSDDFRSKFLPDVAFCVAVPGI